MVMVQISFVAAVCRRKIQWCHEEADSAYSTCNGWVNQRGRPWSYIDALPRQIIFYRWLPRETLEKKALMRFFFLTQTICCEKLTQRF
jgi:hypothetical protein